MRAKTLPLLLTALLLAFALVATGCGGDDGNDEPDVSETTSLEDAQKELDQAEEDIQNSVSEALDDPEALDECKQGAEALSGDEEDQAIEACEQVFGGN